MNNKFFDLKKEKQDRIINAALSVFAKNGYAHASTDEIVREASISKGLLFHYFVSKLGIYQFLVDYCVRFTILEFKSDIRTPSSDLFELHRQVIEAGIMIARKYPWLVLFLYSAQLESDPELKAYISEKFDMLRDSRESLMGGVLEPASALAAGADDITLLLADTYLIEMKRRLIQENFSPDEFRRDMCRLANVMRQL